MPTDAELRALRKVKAAFERYFVHYSAEHDDDDCPGDDTCECPMVLGVEEAFRELESLLRPQEPEQAARERLGQLLQAFDDEIEARAADLARGKGGQHVPFHGDFASVPPSALNRLKWWSRELRAALNERNRK